MSGTDMYIPRASFDMLCGKVGGFTDMKHYY